MEQSRLIAKLQEFGTREDGRRFLEASMLGKGQLEQLARLLDLPVSREDKADRLIDKIIEACIGSRLNSEAIQGISSM